MFCLLPMFHIFVTLFVFIVICTNTGEQDPEIIIISQIGSIKKSRKEKKPKKPKAKNKKKRQSKDPGSAGKRTDDDSEHEREDEQQKSIKSTKSSKVNHQRPGFSMQHEKSAVPKQTGRDRSKVQMFKKDVPKTISPFQDQLFNEEPLMAQPALSKAPPAPSAPPPPPSPEPGKEEKNPHDPLYQTMRGVDTQMMLGPDQKEQPKDTKMVNPHDPDYQTMMGLSNMELDAGGRQPKSAKKEKMADPFDDNYQTLHNVNELF